MSPQNRALGYGIAFGRGASRGSYAIYVADTVGEIKFRFNGVRYTITIYKRVPFAVR